MKFARGFTLIELLIVVATIAILAAIAVPNSLEAQIRAKAASVRNDFRTINVAMQALDELSQLCATEIVDGRRALCNSQPEPRDSSGALLEAANVRMPEALPARQAVASTGKMPPERRFYDPQAMTYGMGCSRPTRGTSDPGKADAGHANCCHQ